MFSFVDYNEEKPVKNISREPFLEKCLEFYCYIFICMPQSSI